MSNMERLTHPSRRKFQIVLSSGSPSPAGSKLSSTEVNHKGDQHCQLRLRGSPTVLKGSTKSPVSPVAQVVQGALSLTVVRSKGDQHYQVHLRGSPAFLEGRVRTTLYLKAQVDRERAHRDSGPARGRPACRRAAYLTFSKDSRRQ